MTDLVVFLWRMLGFILSTFKFLIDQSGPFKNGLEKNLLE